VSLLMLAVVVLFAPALLGLLMLTSSLEGRFLREREDKRQARRGFRPSSLGRGRHDYPHDRVA
jgi:hypothetical protein